jgi:hypothetical protein
VHRRIGLIATAVVALGAITALPATAETKTCDWHVAKVPAPVGYTEQRTWVTGTDSHGNYSGWVESNIADELGDFTYPQVVDENSAGTVLVSGGERGTRRRGAFLFAGGHSGHGTLTYLPSPTGYETDYATALNERGDVLARGHAVKDGHAVSLLWSTLAAGPLVIDTPVGDGIDLDDDGTVLLYDSYKGQGNLWRHGQIVPLTGEPSALFHAIRDGRVIGEKTVAWPDSQSLLWTDPGTPRPIDNGGTAQSINAHGLIAGNRDTYSGPPAVWSGTTFLADLPLPTGLSSDGDYLVGDDGTIFGRVSGYGPLKWTCTGAGA